jgi:PAS domain-containing protein
VKPRQSTNALPITGISDAAFRRRLYLSVLMALYLPPFAGGTLMGIVGYYPLPELYGIFLDYTGLYVLAWTVLGFVAARPAAAYLIGLSRRPAGEASHKLSALLRPFPVYLIVLLTVYSVFGSLSAEPSLVHLGVRKGFTAAEHLSHALGAALPVAVTVFPIFFFFNDTIGAYFGPRGIVPVAVPLGAKFFMLGIMTPLLVDIMLVAYYSNRDHDIDSRALLLWAGLLVLVLGGVLFAWRGLRQSLLPLQRFLTAPVSAERAHEQLVPQSLDEIGALTDALRGRIAREHELRGEIARVAERLFQVTRVPGLGIYDHDQVADTIYWSPGLRGIHGRTQEEVITLEKFLERIHPDDLESIASAVQRAHDPTGDGLFDVEHRIVLPDDTVRWLAYRSQTFFDEAGEARRPVRTVGAVLDVTATRAIEQALRRTRDRKSVV